MTRQGIFISYRHDDSSSAAQRLREHLERVIDPKTVFLDTERIKHGDNFEEEIRKALTEGFFAEELRSDLLSQLRVFEFPYTSKDFRGVDAPIDGFVFPMKAKDRRAARCDEPMREFIEFLRSKEAYRAYDAKNPGSSLSVLKGISYTLEVQKAALGILELNDKDHRVGGFFDREFKIDVPNPTQVFAAPQDPVGEVVIPELHAFLISASKEISTKSVVSRIREKLPQK